MALHRTKDSDAENRCVEHLEQLTCVSPEGKKGSLHILITAKDTLSVGSCIILHHVT